jgi:esterase/lipase
MQVLMLHGAGGGAWEWNVWRRDCVAAGHEVHCPELIPSEAGIEATVFDDYRRQAESAAGVQCDVVIGASLGGLLALGVATSRACGALILVNPLPPAPEAVLLPPRAPYPACIRWGSDASLAGTRDALPDADAATWHYAFRRWRDESGAVLNRARAGIEFERPSCPVAVLASTQDADVPEPVSRALALRLESVFWSVPGSHVGPLLGRSAATCAQQAVQWLNGLRGFRTD